MRLTIVANGDFFSTYGGGQVYVKNLVDELIVRQESEHIDLSVISIAADFSLQPTVKTYRGVTLYETSPRSDFIELLKAINPDLVHVHGEKSKLVALCEHLQIHSVVTAHHGGICCPAGALLNSKDQICKVPCTSLTALPCYLKNIRTGEYWYPIVKLLPIEFYLKMGKILKRWPFIPFLSPIGEAMLSIHEKQQQWTTIKNQATRIIAPSNAIANSMILNGCDSDKISVIPHGVPMTFGGEAESIRTTPRKPIHFYYVGRICYVKGIHVMLKAFSILTESDVYLHLIGGTGNKEEERYAKRLQKKYASDSRIKWHGKVAPEEVREMTQGYHCMIHPTICMEIFGLNISEAQAIGNYVIATRCGGAEMQIHTSKDGVLVAPNSVSELSAAMHEYILHPKASQATVNSMDYHVSELLTLYRNLLPTSK